MEKKKLRKNSKKKNRCGENFGVSKYLNSEKYVFSLQAEMLPE